MIIKSTHNYFVLLALFASCVSLSSAQMIRTRSDREEEKLRGPVKTIQVELVRGNSAELPPDSPKILLRQASYDRNGNVTKSLVKDEKGVQRAHGWNYTYDSEGREIRKEYLDSFGRVTSIGVTRYEGKERVELTQHNPDGTVNHIWEAFFDKRGRLIRDTRNYPTGLGWEHLYKYDADGRLIERINRELGGKVVDTSEWTYDDHGTQTSWIVHKDDGTKIQMFKSQFEYDKAGNISERRDYDPDGSLFNKETYTWQFDAQGNWTRLAKARQRFSKKAITYQQEILYRQITYF